MQCSNVGRARLGRSILAGIVIAAAGGCGGCPGDTDEPPPQPPPPEPPAAREVDMRAREFEFIPNRISAGPEEALRIVLANEGTMLHSIEFELPAGEVGLESPLDPGELGELTFTTPAESGDYEYYCPVGDHRGLGMVGQLTVEPQIELGLRPVAEGLTSPLTMAFVGEPGRALIVDQIGLIRVLTPEGQLLDTPFLDVRDRLVALDPDTADERGLLGLALHPDYASNGRFFVYYSAPLVPGAPAGWDHTNCVVEYRVSAADPNVADIGSEQILLEVNHPQSNHNGGTLAFGPDGYLYISIGDGGAANDVGLGHAPQGNGQDITTMLGKIHRIDINGAAPYSVPPDNPFVGEAGLDEIYAYGLRNPYRMSFDMMGVGALYAGDAGQNLWEEVHIVERGGNHGWRILEGTHCFDPENPDESPQDCPAVGAMGEPLIAPIIEYSHDYGAAVVGGYVYRGDAIPGLQGRYLFGDYSRDDDAPQGTLFSSPSRPSEFGVWPIQRHRIAARSNGELGLYVVGFAQDPDGEMYVFTKETVGPTGTTGRIYQIVPAAAQP
jgi:glucose/arabinose dehydrogenase/plastocyanin